MRYKMSSFRNLMNGFLKLMEPPPEGNHCPEILRGVFWMQDNIANETIVSLESAHWGKPDGPHPNLGIKHCFRNWTTGTGMLGTNSACGERTTLARLSSCSWQKMDQLEQRWLHLRAWCQWQIGGSSRQWNSISCWRWFVENYLGRRKTWERNLLPVLAQKNCIQRCGWEASKDTNLWKASGPRHTSHCSGGMLQLLFVQHFGWPVLIHLWFHWWSSTPCTWSWSGFAVASRFWEAQKGYPNRRERELYLDVSRDVKIISFKLFLLELFMFELRRCVLILLFEVVRSKGSP